MYVRFYLFYFKYYVHCKCVYVKHRKKTKTIGIPLADERFNIWAQILKNTYDLINNFVLLDENYRRSHPEVFLQDSSFKNFLKLHRENCRSRVLLCKVAGFWGLNLMNFFRITFQHNSSWWLLLKVCQIHEYCCFHFSSFNPNMSGGGCGGWGKSCNPGILQHSLTFY